MASDKPNTPEKPRRSKDVLKAAGRVRREFRANQMTTTEVLIRSCLIRPIAAFVFVWLVTWLGALGWVWVKWMYMQWTMLPVFSSREALNTLSPITFMRSTSTNSRAGAFYCTALISVVGLGLDLARWRGPGRRSRDTNAQ